MKQMDFGIERYSRPLLHCIVSPTEHNTLFQNVEKLVTLSDDIAHKLSENSVPYSDLDNSAEKFIDTVGGVFQAKVQYTIITVNYYFSTVIYYFIETPATINKFIKLCH